MTTDRKVFNKISNLKNNEIATIDTNIDSLITDSAIQLKADRYAVASDDVMESAYPTGSEVTIGIGASEWAPHHYDFNWEIKYNGFYRIKTDMYNITNGIRWRVYVNRGMTNTSGSNIYQKSIGGGAQGSDSWATFTFDIYLCKGDLVCFTYYGGNTYSAQGKFRNCELCYTFATDVSEVED